MEEILHQLIGSLSHYLQGFIHPRWLAGFLPSTVSLYPAPYGRVFLFHSRSGRQTVKKSMPFNDENMLSCISKDEIIHQFNIFSEDAETGQNDHSTTGAMISFEFKVAPPNATTPFEIFGFTLGLIKWSWWAIIKAWIFLGGWHCRGEVSFQILRMYTACNNSPLDPLLHLIRTRYIWRTPQTTHQKQKPFLWLQGTLSISKPELMTK